MAKFLRYSVLILPIFFFWAGTKMHKAKFANDPDYIYLVNATAICDGKFVGHIDNPGTTVMQLGALTIQLKHLFSNPKNKPLVEHVFEEPDQFVTAIRFLFLILNTLVLFFLGWFALKKTGSVWVALLLQLSTFITSNTLDHTWTKMSPEPVLFFITGLYVIAILFYYAEKDKTKWKYVFIFALLAGAGLGTKATFLPLVIFPFVVIPTIKKKFTYALAIIPSFVLFTIPAIPEYESMYWWFKGMISHTGKYGHGDKGIIDVQTYVPNIIKIFENNPIFGSLFLFGLVVFVVAVLSSAKKKKRPDWDVRFLAGLVSSIGFGILLVAKHYHFNHYLIPVLLLSGISAFLIVNIILRSNLKKGFNAFVLPAIVIGLALFLGWKQPDKLKYASKGYQLTNEEMVRTNQELEEKYADFARIYFYPFSFYPESALNFGDVYTKRQMLPYLKKGYPNSYFYDFYTKKIQYWNAETNLDEIIEFNGDKVLLLGNRKGNNVISEMEKLGIPVEEIYKGRVLSYYKLESNKYHKNTKQKIVLEENFLNVEMLSGNNQELMDTTKTIFGSARTRSNEEARSGNHSIKLDQNTEFALDFKLESLNVGDNYEVDIWRKADNYSARLVVAGSNNSFYKAQNDYLTSDEKGWDLIRIKFTITPKMEKETLKIYLWNPKKKLAYFDDLSIKKITWN